MKNDSMPKQLMSQGINPSRESMKSTLEQLQKSYFKSNKNTKVAQYYATLVYDKLQNSLTLFRSIRSASRHTGIPESTIRSNLKKHDFYEDQSYLVSSTGGESNGQQSN